MDGLRGRLYVQSISLTDGMLFCLLLFLFMFVAVIMAVVMFVVVVVVMFVFTFVAMFVVMAMIDDDDDGRYITLPLSLPFPFSPPPLFCLFLTHSLPSLASLPSALQLHKPKPKPNLNTTPINPPITPNPPQSTFFSPQE